MGPASKQELGWTTMHLDTSCEHQGQWYGHQRRYDVCGDCGETVERVFGDKRIKPEPPEYITNPVNLVPYTQVQR